MSKPFILDAGILGMASHPRKNPDFAIWLNQLLVADVLVVISEIADYEIRRELIRSNQSTGLARLNLFKETLLYLPVSTSIMLRSAQLWASARNRGKPTADPRELDCDVILATSTLEIDALVVTENIGHLSLFVEARRWSEIDLTKL